MKYLQRSVPSVLALLIAISPLSPVSQSENDSWKFADIRISTANQAYILGEPVRLDLRFTKKGDASTIIEDDSIATGSLRVFIARERGKFLRYSFKGWVAGRTHRYEGRDRYSFDTILFNSKPETAHLSDVGKTKAEEGMILTDYAFPEPGIYRIKATLGFTKVTNGKASWETVESNEISLELKQPEGDDLKVWEIIKADPRIGYFLTSGEAPVRFPSIQDAVMQEVEKITSDYPNSYLSRLLMEKAAARGARLQRIQNEIEKGPNGSKNN